MTAGGTWRVDSDQIRQLPRLRAVEQHEEIGSTNDRALELLQQVNLATPLLILADRQTAGRGRGDHRWWSAAGGLTFSLVFDPVEFSLPREVWPRITLTAAVAMCETALRFAPKVACGLKWPNDVLLNGRKLCGILAEVPALPGRTSQQMVLGMGVNVNNSLASAPEEIRAIATSLTDATDEPIDSTAVLTMLLTEFFGNLERLATADPSLPLRWQELCLHRGQMLQVHQGTQRVGGLCLGIADDGALLLETDQGPQRFYGGLLV